MISLLYCLAQLSIGGGEGIFQLVPQQGSMQYRIEKHRRKGATNMKYKPPHLASIFVWPIFYKAAGGGGGGT